MRFFTLCRSLTRSGKRTKAAGMQMKEAQVRHACMHRQHAYMHMHALPALPCMRSI